ncbi:MAG TPA: carboxypeptidase-like regulatory domain-containing protein [Chitinophagales bacterium]|nr:carboxypeptidase-like regulatory domain-containing protein [Chitinophagales bacterium]
MLPRFIKAAFFLSSFHAGFVVAQTGNSIIIPSVIEAGVSNTKITVDGVPAVIQNESSDLCVVMIPSSLHGSHAITLEEAGNESEANVVILNITPTLERSNLTKGERTELLLNVTGADDLDAPVEIEIGNQSPAQIKIEGSTVAQIRPGRDTTVSIKLRAKLTGEFSISYELSDDIPMVQFSDKGSEAKTDSPKKDACGSIKGKVTVKPPFKVKSLGVYVVNDCDFCEPKPAYTPVTFSYSGEDCLEIKPHKAVVIKDSSFTIKNDCPKEIDAFPDIIPSPVKKDSRKLVVERIERGKSEKITPTIAEEKYLLQDDMVGERREAFFFVVPNPCYAMCDTAGNYSIGLLYPGSYHLKVFAFSPVLKSYPEATVIVKAGQVTIQDFTIDKEEILEKIEKAKKEKEKEKEKKKEQAKKEQGRIE